MSIVNEIMAGKTPKELGLSDREYRIWCQYIRNNGGEPPQLTEGPSLPSKAVMMKNVVKAGADVFLNGRKKASDEEIQRRRDICNGCEHLIAQMNRCAKCGCFLKMKTLLETWSCPVGKW